MSGTLNVADLQQILAKFAANRDWDRFHTPKNLVMALAGEVGELLDEFQWLTPEESAAPAKDKLERIVRELADVQIYVLRLADLLSIDLEAAVRGKIEENGAKYPVELAKGTAEKSARLRP